MLCGTTTTTVAPPPETLTIEKLRKVMALTECAAPSIFDASSAYHAIDCPVGKKAAQGVADLINEKRIGMPCIVVPSLHCPPDKVVFFDGRQVVGLINLETNTAIVEMGLDG
jgi:hypothetical protein